MKNQASLQLKMVETPISGKADEGNILIRANGTGSLLVVDAAGNSTTLGETLPIATPTIIGKVKPDGTSITVTSDGTISAPYADAIAAHNTSETSHQDVRQAIANLQDTTKLRSIPMLTADSNDGFSYFFSWATLGVDTLTIAQLLNSGTVITDAQLVWGADGLTISGVTDAQNKRLVYLIPTSLDTVTDPAIVSVTSIEITGPDTVTDTATYAVSVLPENATNKAVTWLSDATDIATVSNGTVYVQKSGTATITATSVSDPEISGSKQIVCSLSVISTITDIPVTISSIDTGWQYAKPNTASNECTLPHSINAVDSATNNYYRGTVNYKYDLTLDRSKRYYLVLDGANQRGTIKLNDTVVGEAKNAYQPTVVDLTSVDVNNGSNELVVALSNVSDTSAIPYAADYSFYNGLDRGVRVIEAGRLCFSPLTYGTRRCKLTATASTRTIDVLVDIVNHNNSAETCDIEVSVYRGSSDTALVSDTITNQVIAIESTTTVPLSLVIPQDQYVAWNGRSSEVVLYRVEVKLKQSNVVKDTVVDRTAFRTFSVAKHTSTDDGAGFLLNGTAYSLYGTNYHTDKAGRASALTAEDYNIDLALMEALKPTMIKFAHYPCDHQLLDYCDEHGIVAMLEIPWSRNFPPSTSSIAEAYRQNITNAMLSMIKEYYNHPSIAFWCYNNELGMDVTLGYDAAELHTFLTSLYASCKAVDPNRIIGFGPYVNTGGEYIWEDVCDIMLSTHYKGWYGGSVTESLNDANSDNSSMHMPKAINEYGYGANPTHHVSWEDAPNSKPEQVNASDSMHYEEYQAYCLEQYLDQFKNVQWPVFNLQWAIFDFAVASRNEGGTTATNTKGLITRDRSVLKDAYYLYKAYWNPEKMVYICQKKWIDRGSNTSATLHVYSNCAKLELYHNQTLVQTLSEANGVLGVCWTFTARSFVVGSNAFEVRAYTSVDDSTPTATDSWEYEMADPSSSTIEVYGDDDMVNSGTLLYEIQNGGPTTAASWSSSDPAIATITDAGEVTVLSSGVATFTATSQDDSSVSASKTVNCHRINEEDNYFKKMQLAVADTGYADIANVGTVNGVAVTNNHDGTITFNGTYDASTASTPTTIAIWRTSSPYNRGAFPPVGLEGDLLFWCKKISGSVTGLTTDDSNYFRISCTDERGNDLAGTYLAPLGSPDNWSLNRRAVTAKRLTGTSVGVGRITSRSCFTRNVVFDNLVLEVGVAKLLSGQIYNTGIFTNTPSPGTISVLDSTSAVVYRDIDGSYVLHPHNPGSIYMMTGKMTAYLRLWDTFDITSVRHTSTTTNLANAGETIKLSVDLLRIPEITKISADSEIRWVIRGADGSVVAGLDYVEKGTSVVGTVFETGHAELEVALPQAAIGVEFLIANIAFTSQVNVSDNSVIVRFAVKVEKIE